MRSRTNASTPRVCCQISYWRIISLIEVAPKLKHKPNINPVSRELATRKSSVKKSDNIWDHLYSLHREIKEKRDLSYLENKAQQEETSLKGCTFKPTIQRPSRSYDVANKQKKIYERTQQWKRHVNSK